MRLLHCTRAAVVLAAVAIEAPVAAVQQLPPTAPAISEPASNLTIFLRGVPIGSEQSALTRGAGGWTIVGSGRIGAPLDIVTKRLQVRYDSDWNPLELTMDATVRGETQTLKATVTGDTITNAMTTGTASAVTTATTAATVLLTNFAFAAYEALGVRLKSAATGSTIPAYVAPQAPIAIKVGESSAERIQTASQLIETRHTHITITPVGGGPALEADIWADGNGRLLRLSIPAQALEIVREDVASVAARNVPVSRPNDEQFRIPSIGFSLAGTISKPADSGGKRLPAVVFVGGSGATDRDEQIAGIPVIGQLASAVADAGFLTLRYDKRGVGQSGGRIESAALTDLAEDLRAAVKLLSGRKDVDARRIAVVGHSAGGLVALIAGSNEKRIAAVALLAANGIAGSDLVLEQQQHILARTPLSELEKQSRVETQKRLNEAVINGKGWELLPPEVRRTADNAEYQSVLMADPAKIVPNVKQPLLILQGELDTQVAPVNADRLEALARKRKNAPPVEVVKLPGINHLLVAATTGEIEEYGLLKDKHVSPAVANALVTWLKNTLAAK